MDYRHMTAPCGLDCFNCPLYLASNNESWRKAIAEKLNIPESDAVCPGCRAVKGAPVCHGMDEPCLVYKCIEEKGHEFCFECDEFPCDNLHPYADKAREVPHNTKMFNLCLIQRMGLEEWAKEKAKQVKDTYFKKKWKI